MACFSFGEQPLELRRSQAAPDLLLEWTAAGGGIHDALDVNLSDFPAHPREADRDDVHHEAGIDTGSQHAGAVLFADGIELPGERRFTQWGKQQFLTRGDHADPGTRHGFDLGHRVRDFGNGGVKDDVRSCLLQEFIEAPVNAGLAEIGQTSDLGQRTAMFGRINIDPADDLDPRFSGGEFERFDADGAKAKLSNFHPGRILRCQSSLLKVRTAPLIRRQWGDNLSSMRLLLTLVLAGHGYAAATARELTDYSADFQKQLSQSVLPYWLETAVDREEGGFLLADPPEVNRAKEKQIVSQARMIWGFSHAHLKRLGGEKREYLQAARQGYEFLEKHFRDSEQGGYYWTTDRQGKATNQRKIVYGESFVIYGLVEYHRASGDPAPLKAAMKLFQDLQHHAHDPANGGWIEHFERDWTPVLKPDANQQVEVAGYKSANTHLHLMEAFTELYLVTHDRAVGQALEESLELNMRYFYPKDPAQAAFHRQRDWKPVTDPASAGLSYGHNVEFAWLMIRAQQALGRTPAWDHFEAHLDHALAHGYDHQLGGTYNRGVGNEPAGNTDKVWWVQAEMLAALSDAVRHQPKPEYLRVLGSQVEFIQKYQASPKDGIWWDTVTATGAPKVPSKAHNWKANYHDVRGLVKFIEAFPQRVPSEAGKTVK